MSFRTFFFLLAAIAIAAGAGRLAAGERSSLTAWSNGNRRPRIVAHRGAMTERPEDTLAALRRAADVGADVAEIDVRTSKDGVLFLLHDATLDRTTDSTGVATERTIEALKKLDAGSSFDAAYRGERIPTLAEALKACRNRIDLLLDLKESGEAYARRVAHDVKAYGDPARVIIGVRSVEQAKQFRTLLPDARQLGFIGSPKEIEDYVEAGVETVRLWSRWIDGEDGDSIIARVRKAGVRLHINAAKGTPQEILPLLRYRPDALLVDDAAALKQTLDNVERYRRTVSPLEQLIDVDADVGAVGWVADVGAVTFLNRDYRMLALPEALRGKPRIMFAGGEGDRVALRFRKPVVVFTAFEYNASGAWSFPEGFPPGDFGWKLVRRNGYRGTSNATADGKPHYAHVYCRKFAAGESLGAMPPWWVCLAIVEPEEARLLPMVSGELSGASPEAGPFLYSRWATHPRALRVPEFRDSKQWSAWQASTREAFRRRLVFPYDEPIRIVEVDQPSTEAASDRFARQEFHVRSGDRRLFRFFKLTPRIEPSRRAKRMPAIVCFMGHGKVRQILEDRASYQHACAARFAEHGYLVYAMENVGMEPDRDRHHDLDRILRLDGYGWYSLLFAHQHILLDHVFADPAVDVKRVGVTGVSTGGLLALSAIAIDPRVASASVQGIFGSMRVSFIRDRNRHCSCGAIPGLLPQFDLPELALLAAPRPLHISNASHDGFRPAEARRCIELIAPLYRKAGGARPLFTSPPGNHEFAFEPALKFFDGTLRRGH